MALRTAPEGFRGVNYHIIGADSQAQMNKYIRRLDPFQNKTCIPLDKINGWISFIEIHFSGTQGQA